MLKEKVYLYDSNGYYTQEDYAYNQAYPINSTLIAPTTKEGFIPQLVKGEWLLIENHVGERGYVNNEPFEIKEYGAYPQGWSKDKTYTLAELKEQKRQEINAIRDQKEQSGFVYGGSTFDSDSISYQRLVGANITASSALAMGQEFTPIAWTLADNTSRMMTAQDFLQIIPAFAQFSAVLHYQAGLLKEQIDLATTEEELNLIVWE